ncbi:hypothetical protein KR018_009969 [Drosophila ironensis]|nr:hypothetical protein KR018_009969 [Drosophila ironensis]
MEDIDVDMEVKMRNLSIRDNAGHTKAIKRSLVNCFEHMADIAVMTTSGGSHYLTLLADWGAERGVANLTWNKTCDGNGIEIRQSGDFPKRNGSGNGNGHGSESDVQHKSETVEGGMRERHNQHKSSKRPPGGACNHNQLYQSKRQSRQSPDRKRKVENQDDKPWKRRSLSRDVFWHRVKPRLTQFISVVCGFAKDLDMYPDYIRGKFGEDAWFRLSGAQAEYLGVADGVGGWRDYGVDPGEFSMSLMRNCERLARNRNYDPQMPELILEEGFREVQELPRRIVGSSTACIVSLDRTTGILHTANLGDSGFMLVRHGAVVFRSMEQQHQFNSPFQLAIPPEGQESTVFSDSPDRANLTDFQTQPGDVLLLATDGVFDNVPEHILVDVMGNMSGTFDVVRLQKAANALALLARTLGLNPDFDSPFSQNARRAGLDVPGGKPDDVTVILASIG